MRKMFPLLTMVAISFVLIGCQSGEDVTTPQVTSAAASLDDSVVEAGCAGCIFEMEGAEGCELAIKINGKPYLVSGIEVDTHGSGMCESAMEAVVSGKVQGDKFVATQFEIKQQ